MTEVVYAIKTGELNYSGLTVLDVKIGRTTDIDRTLTQYKRGNRTIELLDLWLPNKSLGLSTCESGVHAVAEKYAYERKSENFVFLQDEYGKFSENVSRLLLATEKEDLEDKKEEQEESDQTRIKTIDDYTGKKPQFILLGEDTFKVNSWREALQKLSEKIYSDVDDFSPVLDISGRSRSYFSLDEQELVRAQLISKSDYYFEGNLSAKQIVSVCKRLIERFGYQEDDLEIHVK